MRRGGEKKKFMRMKFFACCHSHNESPIDKKLSPTLPTPAFFLLWEIMRSHVPFSLGAFAPPIAEMEIIGVRERCEVENRMAIPLEDDAAWTVAITR